MKISYRWLKEYVETDLSPEAIADRLTMAGVEVGGTALVAEGLSGVVVGEVEAIERELESRPSGQRVTLCRVALVNERFSVICGAPNVHPGVRAAFAPPGSFLPGGRQVEAMTIRGHRSEGMLCSERELGIGEDSDGILILPPDAPLGADLVTYLGLDDVILEVEITPNRPDCLSVVGIAREIAALTGAPFRFPPVSVKEGEIDAATLATVRVEAPELCPRYAARIITGLTVAPSPPWLAQRLRAVGLRPINNLVDATNYVLWELGHPLHAFDYDRLEGRAIVVRRAMPGERLVTLDGQDRALNDSMLLIADAQRAVGIAGVMGGGNTEVTGQTRTVLLEAAYFDPGSVRRTARGLGLATEAAYRFERGADIEGLREALDRASQLIADLGGGSVARGALDLYPAPRPHLRTSLRLDRIQRLIGSSPSKEEVVRILQGLGFAVEDRKEQLEVVVPSFRRDVTMEDDLVEEVIRVWGYDRIPSTHPGGSVTLVRRPPARRQTESVRRALVGAGLSEVITYSFVDPGRLKLLGWDPGSPNLLALKNPLSQERSLLRPTLATGLLEVLAGNLRRQVSDVRCFEVGRVFSAGGPDGLAQEDLRVGIALTGLRAPRSWFGGRERVDVYDAKGLLEHLLAVLGAEGAETVSCAVPFLEDGRGGALSVAGRRAGIFGEVARAVLDGFDIPGPVYFAECSLDALSGAPTRPQRYQALPKFPGVQRDLALVVPVELSASEVSAAILEIQDPLLRRVTLFDVYSGDQVAAGRKSLAFALLYQADDHTLTDEEVNTIHAAIVTRLTERFGAELRGPGVAAGGRGGT